VLRQKKIFLKKKKNNNYLEQKIFPSFFFIFIKIRRKIKKSVFSFDSISTFLLSSSKQTSSSGGNKTDLLTRGSKSRYSSWVTNMFMVTSSVGMVYGVHSNTSNSRPHFSFRFKSPVLSTSLQNGFIGSLSSGDDSDGGSAVSWDGLSRSGG
jgi:hypothetical protein